VDSNGPDVKVRGSVQQVVDKYLALAREATTGGDPVKAENYYQHAEHYFRVLSANGGGDNRQDKQQRNNRNDRNNANGQHAAANGANTNGANGHANEEEKPATAVNGNGEAEIVSTDPQAPNSAEPAEASKTAESSDSEEAVVERTDIVQEPASEAAPESSEETPPA
tara:strand:- start:21510 stop:22010 length:501 start_codon:yes stop_codon:yes gene_type:complete